MCESPGIWGYFPFSTAVISVLLYLEFVIVVKAVHSSKMALFCSQEGFPSIKLPGILPDGSPLSSDRPLDTKRLELLENRDDVGRADASSFSTQACSSPWTALLTSQDTTWGIVLYQFNGSRTGDNEVMRKSLGIMKKDSGFSFILKLF